MTSKSTIKITVETDEVIIIREAAHRTRVWCAACEKATVFILPEQAATALGLTPHDIGLRIESGELHLREGRDGLLICLNSLLG